MNRYRISSRGFTLIELLLVMVIMVILASVIVPQWHRQRDKASNAKARADLSNLETSLSAFQIDCGRFPTNEEGLSVLLENPGLSTWDGPYVKLLNPDPWGESYIYQAPGTHFPTTYDLYSRGADHQEGSNDDVSNWQS